MKYLFHLFQRYTAEQIAGMIMNDDNGEVKSVDSLVEKDISSSSRDEPSSQSEATTSSSNDESSSQSEVDSSSNSDSEFHERRILIKKRSARNRPLKSSKMTGGI